MAADTPNNVPAMRRISIVIVTRNVAGCLQECLNSIYAQVFPAINIIVIDGASTDGTVEILEKNNNKINFWLSEQDEGIYDAMNKALKYITGEWVYFLGADDELLPGFSAMAAHLNDAGTIYYGNVSADGVKRSGLISPYYMAKAGIYHQAIIYPKSVFKDYKYNTLYKIAADYALNMQLYRDERYKFKYLDFVICKYHTAGISGRQADETFEKDKTRLIFANFGFKIGLRYLFRRLKARLKGNG